MSSRSKWSRWWRSGALAALLACGAFGAQGVASAEGGSEGPAHATTSRTGASHKPQFGVASVYARMLQGRSTASGETHDGSDFTAAHRTLPLGSEVRVTNLANHRSVIVRINDRGPRVRSRIIDLSPRAAAEIGLRARGKGVTRVRLDVLRPGEPTAIRTASSQDVPTR